MSFEINIVIESCMGVVMCGRPVCLVMCGRPVCIVMSGRPVCAVGL